MCDPRRQHSSLITLAAKNETVETDETNETIFFISCRIKWLGHEKKR